MTKIECNITTQSDLPVFYMLMDDIINCPFTHSKIMEFTLTFFSMVFFFFPVMPRKVLFVSTGTIIKKS